MRQRSAASRAKQSIEERRDRKQREKENNPCSRDKWKYYLFLLLMSGGALQMIIPLLDQVWVPSGGWYEDISTTEQLKEVFLSGQPWMIICLNENFDAYGKIFKDASYYQNDAKLNLGRVDCEQELPSGKTVRQRFKLKQIPEPQVYYVANGRKPKPVPRAYINAQDSDRGTAAEILLEHVKSQTKMNPIEVSSSNNLRDKCLSQPISGIVLNPGKSLEEYATQALFGAMNKFRNMSICVVNTKKRAFSLEDKLPDLLVDPGYDTPRFVFFKKLPPPEGQGGLKSKKKDKKSGLVVGAKAHREPFDKDSLISFLEPLVKGSPKMKPLKKVPTLSVRKKKKGKKTGNKRSAKSQEGDDQAEVKNRAEARAKAKAERERKFDERRAERRKKKAEAEKVKAAAEKKQTKLTEEEQHKARTEREQRRREQMDEEAESFNPQAVSDDDIDDADVEEEEADEEIFDFDEE